MGTQVTLGGDRLGAGKRMKVNLHGYERSTHDMGYLWRSTMSAGTLVPFMVEVGLNGDTFDIDLDAILMTHPTVGPLFGSYKIQLDVFTAAFRLYQGQLHNNKLGIGLQMQNILLPQMELFVDPGLDVVNSGDVDNSQINPSCILSYLNIRGVGIVDPAEPAIVSRQFNAIPYLAYWDIYKNYYANKQEGLGYVIHNENIAVDPTIEEVRVGTDIVGTDPVFITSNAVITIDFLVTEPPTWQVIFQTSQGDLSLEYIGDLYSQSAGATEYLWKYALTGDIQVFGWRYIQDSEMPQTRPNLTPFDLEALDDMREKILAATLTGGAFIVNDEAQPVSPYGYLLNWENERSTYLFSQQGLGLKTYQSDLFNNWLSEEWIDGAQGINEITAIDTSGGSFSIDTLNLSKKVYDMLNRIAVTGGSYDDWQEAVYDHKAYGKPETPVYHGGLIRELIFQEVISNSEANGGDAGTQPLGTLAGKGVMSGKKKGGSITIKIDEPSYIIGIISLTPRIDYSQGNKWDVHLKTMNDLHKPALDEIGFQDLMTEQMAWFTTTRPLAGEWTMKSAGKQPAWINYMTNVNQTRGNFAIADNEMFMTLNRRYEWEDGGNIADLSTYIDPVKFNHIFADTAIDAQNFWAQIAVDMTARRKMSAKLMPNL